MNTVTPPKSAAAKPRLTEKARKLTFKEQQELKALECSMPKLEAEIKALEEALSGGLSDPQQIAEASQRYEAAKDELDSQELRWLELSEI